MTVLTTLLLCCLELSSFLSFIVIETKFILDIFHPLEHFVHYKFDAK